MRCGEDDADWLVTAPYAGGRGPGRLLAYCDGCRDEVRRDLWVAIPMCLLGDDPAATLLPLYEAGLTESNPRLIAESLLVEGPWVEQAARHLH